MTMIFETVKSIAKVILQSRRCKAPTPADNRRIVILGNGPSLKNTIVSDYDILKSATLMTVNFAAATPVFGELRPEYYILADPHFFKPEPDPNVCELFGRLAEVDWRMTLFVPAKSVKWVKGLLSNDCLKVCGYNAVGVEGWLPLVRHWYRSGRGMPRPRNVLVPAIMMAIRMGFKQIDIVGADHTWIKDITVDTDNRMSIAPAHYYKEAESEKKRIAAVHSSRTVLDALTDFCVALRSYGALEHYARRLGVNIRNCTPESLIDIFERGRIEDVN